MVTLHDITLLYMMLYVLLTVQSVDRLYRNAKVIYCGNGPHSAESKGTDSIHIRIPRRIPVMNMIVQITIDIVC